MKKYAIVFLAWGGEFIKEVQSCLSNSETYLEGYDRILITDTDTEVGEVEGLIDHIIRAEFKQRGLLRKTELHEYLPDGYSVFLLLDSDTVVMQDISLGFEKAEIHGIAASPAPHYSLDAFWGFEKVMMMEKMVTKGQLQYNTGVVFFKNSQTVRAIFKQWGILGNCYQSEFKNDQPFFTLAMEALDFSPYTLSISYNYRGFGDAISGDVRIWHSHGCVPEGINEYNITWPPRRAWPERVEYSDQTNTVKECEGGFAMFKRMIRKWLQS